MKDIMDIYFDIKNYSYSNLRRTYLFFRYKYPKFVLLIFSIIFAYYIFTNPLVLKFVSGLDYLGYIGIFIAGLLFAFGFSAPFAVGFFIALQPTNIFLAALIGGIGAFVSDMLIFRFIKVSFEDEFNSFKNERPIKRLSKVFRNRKSFKIGNYLMYFIAGILIASPLPDEVGVTLIAGLTKINAKILGLISFVLNTLGIGLILFLSM